MCVCVCVYVWGGWVGGCGRAGVRAGVHAAWMHVCVGSWGNQVNGCMCGSIGSYLM